MEINRGSCRCKLNPGEIVTGVILAHRQKVFRKISKFFPGIRSKDFVNIRSSVGIVIVHHIYLHEGDRQYCLIDMYDLNIRIRALVVSNNRV